MIVHVGDDDLGRHLYAVQFAPGCLQALPWGDTQFDCTVVVCNAREARHRAEEISIEVVDANTDWVNTTGPDAEWLHDVIDRTSVDRGRQGKVGDGDPMTSWHEDAVNDSQMAEVARGGWGGHDNVLALVVGDKEDFARFVALLRDSLPAESD